MLALSRKRDQVILLTHEDTEEVISITIVEIRGDRTKLGIHANSKWRIDRAECWGHHHGGNPNDVH